MTRVLRETVDRLAKLEIANCGRWCEVTLKKTGEVVRVIRTGYGPMECPEWDSHKVLVNGNEMPGAEFDSLYELAAWMIERRG